MFPKPRSHCWIHILGYNFGPAKTDILRGTRRTYAIKTRAVAGNSTIKKGPRKRNRGPVRETDGPKRETESPVAGTGPLLKFTCTKPLLIAPGPLTVLNVRVRADL